MSDETTAPETTPVETAPVEDNQPSYNPAWSELMEAMPSSLHPLMAPHLQKWDQNFQQVQERFNPYKDFADRNISADALNTSLQVAQTLDTNPGLVLEKLIENAQVLGLDLTKYGFGQQQNPSQGQPGSNDTVDFSQVPDFSNDGQVDISQHPQVLALQQQLQNLQEFTTSRYEAEQQAAQQAQEDAMLEQALTSLSQQHGELPQEHLKTVFALATSGTPLEQAYEYVAGLTRQPATPAPRVMSPGGGLPTSAVDVANISDKDRKSLAISWLQSSREGS